ncbi:outer membrane beta-barrel protein [Catalinimonas alkaloidigena]|nr:outer membrane beta-barrel protein [Catalinimonas alkaloidigena]
MIKKSIGLLCLTALTTGLAQAQDSTSTSPLEISGSVDLYYKADFAGVPNIETSFADENNSISIGMIDIALSKTVGKATFVGEVAFGPRGQYQSIPNSGVDNNSFHIQNLYASYAVTDMVSITAGYMGTFVGYEVISPTGNYNYSTSRMFTNGPFQNAGVKVDLAISDRVGLMVGLFNDWNVYQDLDGLSDFGAQLYLSPVDGWDAYLNLITGGTAYGYGTEIDLTTGYQITDAFYLGLNAASLTLSDAAASDNTTKGFYGVALYPQVALTESFGLGLRFEHFKWKDLEEGGTTLENPSYNSITLSANVKAGPLTIIPEFRFDGSDQNVFYSSADIMNSEAGFDSKSASQVLVGVVYGF